MPGVAARGEVVTPSTELWQTLSPLSGEGEGGRRGREGRGQWQKLNVFLLHLGDVDLRKKLVLEIFLADFNLMLNQT